MQRIFWLRGDITRMRADALVNAANGRLAGGGGVDGAIHRAGGSAIARACARARERLGGRLPTGEAVETTAGELPARYVIHTVGPVWDGDQPDLMQDLLASCYRNSLHLADDLRIATIAFPNISTGVYGFPKPLAAEVAIEAVSKVLERLERIEAAYFVCYDAENAALYQKYLGQPLPDPPLD